jgi:oxygen-independent coproporphyrinogen-3 oxidase
MAAVPLPPLSLYVHLPWCVRKCPYCDFNSYETRGALPESAYVDALLRDLAAEAAHAEGRPLESVFIGGGTPSLFSGESIARLLAGIAAQIAFAPGAEITLEANPGAADAARFAAYCGAGVTRLSIGVQSLRDPMLRRLGRVHDSAAARDAVMAAQAAGFASVNVDLMYGLPQDDAAGALADLREALALQTQHVSWYQLTLEPHTAFHRRPPPLPAEDDVVALEREGRALLADHGYERYEISAYARPGFRCTHNLNYWRFGDYLGIGAGAHGKITRPDGTIERSAKTRSPRTYVEQAGSTRARSSDRVTDGGAIALEFLMNALRLPEGVSARSFEERTRQSLATIAGPLAAARRRGWLAADSGVLRATPEGLPVLNAVLALF